MAYLVDRAVLPPGACYVCRSPKRETESAMLDTMREVEFDHIAEARLYLCETCITEYATMFGFVTPAMAARYVDERDAAIRQATDLLAEVEALRAVKDAIEAFRPAPEDVVLKATPKYACKVCLGEGIVKDCTNPQGLKRHLTTKHDLPSGFVVRGDEVLELTAGMEVEA